MEIKVGDWVRFYRGGEFVIGLVEYIRPVVAFDDEICTDQGATTKKSILEVRHEARHD